MSLNSRSVPMNDSSWMHQDKTTKMNRMRIYKLQTYKITYFFLIDASSCAHVLVNDVGSENQAFPTIWLNFCPPSILTKGSP